MKKKYWIAMIVLSIILVSCNIYEELPDVTVNQEVEEPIPEGQLENPPNVYVISGNQKIVAVQGVTTWTIDLGNGKFRSINSDSAAPMGLVKYQMDQLTVKPGDEINIQLAIDFSSLDVIEWSDAGPGKLVSLTDYGFVMSPGVSSRVYEIKVQYEQGIVHYAFEVAVSEEVSLKNLIYPTNEAMEALKAAYNKDPYYYVKDTKVYNEVVSLGEGTIEFCRESLMALSSVESDYEIKEFYEWVISETIRYNFPEELYSGRVEYFETTIKSDCKTYAIIGEDVLVWSELKKDTMIQITEMLSMDYFIGRRIGEAFAEDMTGVDTVRFIIKREDLVNPFSKDVMGYHIPRLSYLDEFNLIAVSDEAPVTDNAGRKIVKIPVYDQPSEIGTFIGYIYSGDLLKYAKDDDRHPIKSGAWSLVDVIPYEWCINSNSAWIKNEHLEDVTRVTVANAGFVMAGTKLYSQPDMGSLALLSSEIDDPTFVDPFRFGDVYCVRVLGEEGAFYKISDEINGNVHGYVLKEDLFFYVDEQLVTQLETVKPNMDMFTSRVKSQIINSEIELTAKDLNINYSLSREEKEMLAHLLKSIESWEGFDGGIRPYREATYPFISLDLGDCELVLAEGGRLLITVGQREAYYYGIGSRGMPIRFMSPNKEFIDHLFELVAVPDLVDTEDMIYLLTAKQVEIIIDDEEVGDFYDRQVHINHAVRGILNVLGKPIDAPELVLVENKVLFRFTMQDGEMVDVVYEDDRILFRNQWYQASKDVRDTVSNMFAAYF